MHVRRVVTGHDREGPAVFASDEEVDRVTTPLLPGAEFCRLWGADDVPTVPDGGAAPAVPMFFPPVGGCRFGVFTLPPENESSPPDGLDTAAALADLEAALPGLMNVMEPDPAGMHRTDTLDFEVVLSGQLVLELDDGAERILNPGNTLVQIGTRHRWRNRGDRPAVIAFFMTGATRR
jgi:mannose-6-phosphate isomerase-like protein (cupin superfamily)